MSFTLRLPITAAQIREVWESDEKLDVAAARLGCSVGTLLYRMRIAGLPRRFAARGHRLSPETHEQLLAAAAGDEPAKVIAQRFGVCTTTVWKWRRKQKGRARAMYRYDREKLRRACECGWTLRQIADALKLPDCTVRHALKRFGLRYRRTSNRKPIDRDAFVRDFKAGVSMSEMARRHGFSGPSAVKSRLQREGLLR